MHFKIIIYFVEKESEGNPCLISFKCTHQLDRCQAQVARHRYLLAPLSWIHCCHLILSKQEALGIEGLTLLSHQLPFSKWMEYNTEL